MKRTLPILFLLVLLNCNKDKFLGFVYPNKFDLSTHKIIGEFDSLNECLEAVNRSAGSLGSYECGKNCDPSTMPMRCEETIGNEK